MIPPTTFAPESRLQLASRLFREFYTSCFWHYRPDLSITEDKIPLLVKELRRNGGKRGFMAAARLQAPGSTTGACR